MPSRNTQMTSVLAFACIILAAGCILWPTGAKAAPFRYFGFDTMSMAGANADVAYGNSYGVVYSNPALMSRFEPALGVNLMVFTEQFNIDLMDRPRAADISTLYYDTQVSNYTQNGDRALATQELSSRSRKNTKNDDTMFYVGLGTTYSFGIDGFRLGGLLMLPVVHRIGGKTVFAQVDMGMRYYDEREQYYTNQLHFARFGEWQRILTGLLGVSYSPIKQLSIGVSAQLSATSKADLNLYIPEVTVEDYGLNNIDMKLGLTARPIVGIQAEPLEWLALGLVWKGESYISVDGKGGLNLYNYHETYTNQKDQRTIPKRVNQKYKFAIDYEPMEVNASIGARYKTWNIQGVMSWDRWSKFKDEHNETPQKAVAYNPVNPGDPIINGKAFRWSDTLNVSVNTSWKYLETTEAKIGFAYRPSPVPAQVGRTSYADADAWGISAGHHFEFEEDFSFDLGFQFWSLLSRKVYKDPRLMRDEFPDGSATNSGAEGNQAVATAQGVQTNNPGFPGYSLNGWQIVVSAAVSYKF